MVALEQESAFRPQAYLQAGCAVPEVASISGVRASLEQWRPPILFGLRLHSGNFDYHSSFNRMFERALAALLPGSRTRSAGEGRTRILPDQFSSKRPSID